MATRIVRGQTNLRTKECERQYICTITNEHGPFVSSGVRQLRLPRTTDAIHAVLPQLLIPSKRYYRQLCPHHRGNSVDIAVIPSSPLPYSSLISTIRLYSECHSRWFMLENIHCVQKKNTHSHFLSYLHE